MDRNISAYALAEEIESLDITVAGKPARWNDAKHTVLRIIAEQPTVDAVEVVRCKDCKHWEKDGSDDPEGMCTNPDGLDNYAYCTDFCSYGERKEKGE